MRELKKSLLTFCIKVEGMTELNQSKAIKVKKVGNYTFSIGDTSQFSDYIEGGIVTQVNINV